MSEVDDLYRKCYEVVSEFGLKFDESMVAISFREKFAEPFLLLNQYDNKRVVSPPRALLEDEQNMMFADEEEWAKAKREFYILEAKTAYNLVNFVKQKFPENHGFGVESESGKLEGIINSVYQNAFGQGYHTPMEKAANLLYFVVKNHPFVNGNKRIAVFLFCMFLEMHIPDFVEKKIGYAALPAVALFIAVSDSQDKNLVVNLVIRLFQG